MTELERRLREAIDAPLTENPWNGSHRRHPLIGLDIEGDAPGYLAHLDVSVVPFRRGARFRPRISFAWHHVYLAAMPGPGWLERILDAIWLNNPLSRFNRRARNAEELAFWKTVWR